MPDVNSNASLRIFHAGGTVDFIEGATTSTIRNILEGTIELTFPREQQVEHNDSGVPQPPYRGMKLRGSLSLTVRCGAFSGADSVYALLTAAPTTNNVHQIDSVVIRRPNVAHGATGTTITIANAYLTEAPRFTVSDGGDHDRLTINFGFTADPTFGTY